MDADALALRVAEALLSREGTGPAWDLKIEEARVGFSRLSMKVLTSMLNGHGTIHGGMIFALADTAFAYACNSRNEASVAQSASITFLAPASVNDVLTAEARELALTKRSGSYHVSIRNDRGEPIAEFLGHSRTIGGAVVEISL
jgi:acyl-CoA thioesterase